MDITNRPTASSTIIFTPLPSLSLSLKILFISGLTLVIGFRKTLAFFARKQKLKGTVCFLLGVLLVFVRWPIIGMGVEAFGFINLFGDFFPGKE